MVGRSSELKQRGPRQCEGRCVLTLVTEGAQGDHVDDVGLEQRPHGLNAA